MLDGRRVMMVVTTGFEPDPRVYKEAVSLRRHGYDLTVVAWDREARLPPVERCDGITVWRYRRRSPIGGRFRQLSGFLGFFLFAWEKLRQGRYDVVHCHDLDTMPLGLVARWRGLRVIFDVHEMDYYNLYPFPFPFLFLLFERVAARCAHGVLLTVDVQWKKYGKWRIREAVQLRNVPPRGFVEQADSWRRDKQGRLVVGRVGFIKRGTGIEEIFAALELLRRQGYDVEALLVGKVHPDIREELEERLRLAPYVQHVGAVPYPEVPRYYAMLDVAVALYTRLEEHRFITPAKLLECLSCGVPVIANPVGDVARLAQRFGGIVLVPEPSSEALADSLRVLLDDPGRLQRLKEETRAARDEFVWEKMEERLVSFYKRILGDC
ncbi:MAG: glycosyltransferase [candidate division KSB1 bacterium]|nr:glycosyltransferase [candidate division KSB1 bacterium]